MSGKASSYFIAFQFTLTAMNTLAGLESNLMGSFTVSVALSIAE